MQVFSSNPTLSCSLGSCLPLLARAPPTRTQWRLRVQLAWDYKAILVFCHVTGAFGRWKVSKPQAESPLTMRREVATTLNSPAGNSAPKG